MKKVVFLYSELAGYVLTCLNRLSEERGLEVHLVKWPVNKEAPFQFEFRDKIQVYNKEDYSRKALEDLVDDIQPDLLFVSGWLDKDYLSLAKKWKRKIKVIVGFDNKWEGKPKQRVASLLKGVFIKPYFTDAWVPDIEQVTFAKKLGFKKESIHKGYYTADIAPFNEIYKVKNALKKPLAKKFIYVGRYYDFKGIKDLWDAFSTLSKEGEFEWELHCIGTGDIKPMDHPKIKHFGFVQPDQLSTYLKEASVFVLPSHVEPWGVVVHEMAAAGFPLICSDKVGANKAFLHNNKNGFIFRASDKEELKNCLKKMVNLPDDEILRMGDFSHKLAQKVNPEKWTQTLLEILNNK